MPERTSLNVGDDFDESILDDRRRLVERLERMAREASSYRSRPVGEWSGTLPVVAAGFSDALMQSAHLGSDLGSSLSIQELHEAMDRSGVAVDHLRSADLDTVRNAVNKAVGSAFEIDVRNALQAGELHAPVGTDHFQQYSFTNPGADFGFSGIDGHRQILMNTKASLGYSVIQNHFVEYPHVNYVYATHEAAVEAARHGVQVVDGVHGVIPVVDHPIVIDTGMSASDYRHAFNDLVSSDHHHLFGWFGDDSVLGHVPWITLGLLTYRAARRHNSGMAIAENKRQGLRDLSRSGAAYGAATVLQHVGVPVPVTIVGSMFAAATTRGIFDVKDEWQFLAQYDETLANRLTKVAE